MPEQSIVIATPIGTRLRRIERRKQHWILWTDTKDFVHGTYLQLWDNGAVFNVTTRDGEGPEEFLVKESDT